MIIRSGSRVFTYEGSWVTYNLTESSDAKTLTARHRNYVFCLLLTRRFLLPFGCSVGRVSLMLSTIFLSRFVFFLALLRHCLWGTPYASSASSLSVSYLRSSSCSLSMFPLYWQMHFNVGRPWWCVLLVNLSVCVYWAPVSKMSRDSVRAFDHYRSQTPARRPKNQ